MKKIFFGALIVLLFPSYSIFAQNGLGTKIASVNVQQAQVQQIGNEYTVSFTITNGTGIQTGLRYSVQLLKQDTKNKKQYVVDEKVYDETLTLRENDSVTKQVRYVPPSTLTGPYQMVVAVYNNSGFPFAIAPAGDITVTGGKGLVVYPETCVVQAGAAKNDVGTSVLVFPHTKLSVQCSVKNESGTSITTQPIVETKVGNLFGTDAQVESAEIATVSFLPGEQKTVTVVLPKAIEPQVYTSKLLIGGRQTDSNPIFVRYTVYGTTATIQNLSFDKDSYQANDAANLSLFWTGSVASTHLTLSVKNMLGVSCADTVEQVVSTKPIAQIPVAITRTCKNPTVMVMLKDSDGTILDQKDFVIQSAQTSTKKPWIILAAVLVGLVGLGLYMKKRKEGNKQEIVTPVVMLLVGVFLSFFSPNTAHADSYSSGPNGEIVSVVNLPDGGIYNPGASIKVTAQVFNQSASSAYPISLSVTNNGIQVDLILATTLNAGQNTAVYPYTFTNPYGAPNDIGTYPMKFTTGIDVTPLVGFNWGGVSSAPVQGGTQDTNVYCYAQLTQAATSDSVVYFSYQTQLTPFTWESCSVDILAGQTGAENYPGREYALPSGESIQVTNFCYDEGFSSFPNNPSSGAPSC
jgi:hypothetical protein